MHKNNIGGDGQKCYSASVMKYNQTNKTIAQLASHSFRSALNTLCHIRARNSSPRICSPKPA